MDQRFLQRGEQFSAGYRREQYEKNLVEGTDYSLPRNQFIEDSAEAGAVHEASAADPIPASNKGYKLLQLMGWSGTGLGKHENGLTAPVDVGAVDSGSRMGLGRAQLEQSIVEAETSTRRQLDVEQQMRETETQREQRMQRAGHREVVEKQVADMNRTFYCEVCCKQYKSIAELEEHLSSYDHHHRKRLQEMKQMELERTRDSRSKKESRRLAKEQARLEKQIAAAHQGKTAASVGQAAAPGASNSAPAPPLINAPPSAAPPPLPSAPPPLPHAPPPPCDAPPLPDEPPPHAAPLPWTAAHPPPPHAPRLPPAPQPYGAASPLPWQSHPPAAPPPLPPAPPLPGVPPARAGPPLPPRPEHAYAPAPHLSSHAHHTGGRYSSTDGWPASSQHASSPPTGQAPSSQPRHRVPPPPPQAPEAKPLSLSLGNNNRRPSQPSSQVSMSLAKPRSGPGRSLSMFAADDSD